MLKIIRQQRGLSQNQLATLVGTSVQNIQKIEYGKTRGIQYEILNKLCLALQCQPGDLLIWTPDDFQENSSAQTKPNTSVELPERGESNDSTDSTISSITSLFSDLNKSA